MWATAEESRDRIVGLYREVSRNSDAVIAEVPLDAPAFVEWWPPSGSTRRSATCWRGCWPRPPSTPATPRSSGRRSTGRAGATTTQVGDAEWWEKYVGQDPGRGRHVPLTGPTVARPCPAERGSSRGAGISSQQLVRLERQVEQAGARPRAPSAGPSTRLPPVRTATRQRGRCSARAHGPGRRTRRSRSQPERVPAPAAGRAGRDGPPSGSTAAAGRRRGRPADPPPAGRSPRTRSCCGPTPNRSTSSAAGAGPRPGPASPPAGLDQLGQRREPGPPLVVLDHRPQHAELRAERW